MPMTNHAGSRLKAGCGVKDAGRWCCPTRFTRGSYSTRCLDLPDRHWGWSAESPRMPRGDRDAARGGVPVLPRRGGGNLRNAGRPWAGDGAIAAIFSTGDRGRCRGTGGVRVEPGGCRSVTVSCATRCSSGSTSTARAAGLKCGGDDPRTRAARVVALLSPRQPGCTK